MVDQKIIKEACLYGTTSDNFDFVKNRYAKLFLDNLTTPKLRNAIRAGWYYFSKTTGMDFYPLVIKVETSAVCNLSCPGCIHGTASGKFSREQMIPKSTFKKLIDEIGQYLLLAVMYHRGEPFFNKDIFDMIAYTSRYNVISSVSTNFSIPFKTDDFRDMVSSGLKHLILSIDGITQEVYEKYRRGGNLELVKHNIEELVAIKKKMGSRYPILEQQFVLFEHNYHQWKQVRGFAEKLGIDRVSFVKDMTVETNLYIGGFKKEEHGREEIVAKRFFPLCEWPWFAAVVKWNGEILPCCDYDWLLEKSDFGNIERDSFKKIWNSKRYKDLRMSLAHGYKNKKIDPYCAYCPSLRINSSATKPKLK